MAATAAAASTGRSWVPYLPECEFPPSGGVISLTTARDCDATTGYVQVEGYRLIILADELTSGGRFGAVDVAVPIRALEGAAGLRTAGHPLAPPIVARCTLIVGTEAVGMAEVRRVLLIEPQIVELRIPITEETSFSTDEMALLLEFESEEGTLLPGWVLESSESRPFTVTI